jgi:hypothetical protein
MPKVDRFTPNHSLKRHRPIHAGDPISFIQEKWVARTSRAMTTAFPTMKITL